jgi:hypothetical protein
VVRSGELSTVPTRLDVGSLLAGIYVLTVLNPHRGPLVRQIVVE